MLPALSITVEYNELEVVKILVEGSVPFLSKDADHQTPYQRAKKGWE